MIYIKNNTEIQTIFIPRNELQREAYIASTKTYEDGYRDGLEDGKEQQKDKLLNLYVTENGQYEREDGWGIVTVDTPDCSDAYNKGYEDGYNQGQAECPDCPEGGSCNLGEGEFMFGTSDVGRYELNASDDGYDGWSKIYLEIEGEGAIKVFRAADLLNSFNNDNGAGLDYGWNYYVGGEITEIQEISTQYGNATYILDNGFKIYRGKWIDGNGFSSEDQIKVGAYIVVYGVLAEYKGTLQLNKNSQVIAYQECTGGEIISCNLEDKQVTPSMNDRDSNGHIVVSPSEGYDGLSRTVIDPQNIYNEGVEAGKTEKETDIAENARVLNVTENGVYKTKFSDKTIIAEPTGIYENGDLFFDYAYLNNIQYNTNIYPMSNTKMEIWWKYDGSKEGNEGCIIGCQNWGYANSIFKIGWNFMDNRLLASINDDTIFIPFIKGWNHIVMSYADGLWLNGVKIGAFPSNITDDMGNKEPICINGYYGNTRMNSDYFGMVKINDVVFIPTENGFLNTSTNELLPIRREGEYTYTSVVPEYDEPTGELYKTINVNVPQEVLSCNLEDKSVTPSMSDRDDNGYIVVSPSEGYNGLSRTVINPQTLYNEGVEAGRTEGEASLAAKARVLNVTENGVYKSKFSDPIPPTLVTGIYADGTKFHNYAELNDKVFNTKIAATIDSRLEFWYKGDNQKSGGGWNVIIGSGDNNNSNCFQVRYFISFNNWLKIEVGNSAIDVKNWDDTVWHHLIVSKAEGLWVDGEKKGDFSPTNTVDGEFYINGAAYDVNVDGFKNANGTFGMVKINDVVFIPTANGFQNVNTGELLQVVKDGGYTFTENLPIYAEGELYKTINVNVPSVQDEALQYDTIAFSYTVYGWHNHNINRDNMTTNCGDRPLDCLLFRNRLGECTVMTKLDNCSGTAQLENGWTEDNIIRTLKSKTITKFLSNSINSNQLTSIDTGLAQLKENAIINCNALTDIKLAILNNNLSVQFASNCFNGLPADGTITIGKTADVTLTDDEITSFFRTIVGEGWTITIK